MLRAPVLQHVRITLCGKLSFVKTQIRCAIAELAEMHKPPYQRFIIITAGVLSPVQVVARITTQNLVIQVNGGCLPFYAELEALCTIQGENSTTSPYQSWLERWNWPLHILARTKFTQVTRELHTVGQVVGAEAKICASVPGPVIDLP